LFTIITKCIHSFSIQKLKNKLVLAEKELQQARKNDQVLARYINARRKKEEARRKEEEAQKKVMVVARRFDEGQSFKDVRTWRK
jgi:predicted Holliday junction resolvase-like endonuclease